MQSSITSPVTSFQKVQISPEPLYQLLFGRSMSQILLTACDLDLFEELSGGPRTLEELCEALALPPHSADMLLNTCVALRLLRKEGDRYSNTPLAQDYLLKGSSFYMGGLFDHFKAHVFPAWDKLNEAIQQDGPQVKGKSNVDMFKVTQALDRDTELFISAMHNLSVSDGIILAEGFDFSPYHQVVDIGGGSGALSLAVAERFLNLKATIFDRPQVCALTERYIQAAGLQGRVKAQGGDAFTDSLPQGMDVALLSLFIHAFGLERSTPILKKCFEALPPGGCVLIYEPMLEPSRTGPLTTLLSSLNMLLVTPSGGDVTAQDYMKWLEDLGFVDVFYKPLPSVRHLVGGYKPRT